MAIAERPVNRSIVAMLYDFDKTLTPLDMQEFAFFPAIGTEAAEFWQRADSISDTQVMDMILASMYLMWEACQEKNIPMTRDFLRECGGPIQFFPGLPDWFDRINAYGEEHGVVIEHYIISSGLKEIIEGTELSSYFKKIFASEYFYDESGLARWPLNSVNYTGKTQYLFRVNKGILDISDDHVMSAYIPEDDRRIPFENMIYIGDGLTDIPCMKLVRSQGGYSIAVHPPGGYKTVDFLQRQRRVNFVTEADYRPESELSKVTEEIIMKIATRSRIQKHQAQQERQNALLHAKTLEGAADSE